VRHCGKVGGQSDDLAPAMDSIGSYRDTAGQGHGRCYRMRILDHLSALAPAADAGEYGRQEFLGKWFGVKNMAKYSRTRSPVGAADIDGWRARELNDLIAPLSMGHDQEFPVHSLIRDHLILPSWPSQSDSETGASHTGPGSRPRPHGHGAEREGKSERASERERERERERDFMITLARHFSITFPRGLVGPCVAWFFYHLGRERVCRECVEWQCDRVSV